MRKMAVFALVVLSSAASAETLTCPVGGEQFVAPLAGTCVEEGGQTMLRRPLGCPPDPMPQCPQNFLPMYRVFSAEEIPVLKQYMQSESYESNVDFSPYYLAYIIEKYLNGPDEQLPARLLLRGLWQDPALISDDPAYMSALTYELEQTLAHATKDEAAMTLGMLGFLQLLGGNAEAAQAYIARAESQKTPAAQGYIAAVSACLADPTRPHCQATAAIPQP
jgi:hypothetical protein